MLFSSWLRNRQRSAPAPCRGRPTSPPQRASFRPGLEILEDRTLLSTYVVNSLTDTGTGSGLAGDLRYCIAHATSGSDTISFAANLTGTITLESPLPTLNASVAIQGPGAAALTVEKDPLEIASFNILAVASTATVEISGLTLVGGITNSGTATVSGSTWTSVQVNPGYNNGAISAGPIDNTGTMTISGSVLYGPGSFIGTAAIDNSGVLTLNYSTVEGISAVPGILGGNAYGGAIFNQGALTINNSTLTNNEVQGGRGTSTQGDRSAAGNGMGGGI